MVTFEWPFMTWKHCLFYQNMQYQVDPTDKTQENGQKCHFWLIWSFKNKCLTFLNDPACAPNILERLFLSDYAISSWPDRPNSRKWPKTSFLAIWIIQKWFFMVFEWSSMCNMVTKLLRTFSIIKICNMKSIRLTKLQK